MTQLKLLSRTESAGTDKMQLQFADVTSGGEGPMGAVMPQGVNLSGYFPAAYANELEVGAVYELELTKVV